MVSGGLIRSYIRNSDRRTSFAETETIQVKIQFRETNHLFPSLEMRNGKVMRLLFFSNYLECNFLFITNFVSLSKTGVVDGYT